MDSGTPFSAVLIGQPTLRQRLRLGVLAALDQRLSVRYTLAGMTSTETADYINHHLKLAGRSDTLFSADAITLIHTASRGYPRAINNLAIGSLIAAFAHNNPPSMRKPPEPPSPKPEPTDQTITTPSTPSPRRPRPRPPPADGAFSHPTHRQHP